MLDEQIQSHRISFELTNLNLSFDPEFVDHVYMNVWHHWQTANHEPRLKVLLKVKKLKNMMNLNAFKMKKIFVNERGQMRVRVCVCVW